MRHAFKSAGPCFILATLLITTLAGTDASIAQPIYELRIIQVEDGPDDDTFEVNNTGVLDRTEDPSPIDLLFRVDIRLRSVSPTGRIYDYFDLRLHDGAAGGRFSAARLTDAEDGRLDIDDWRGLYPRARLSDDNASILNGGQDAIDGAPELAILPAIGAGGNEVVEPSWLWTYKFRYTNDGVGDGPVTIHADGDNLYGQGFDDLPVIDARFRIIPAPGAGAILLTGILACATRRRR